MPVKPVPVMTTVDPSAPLVGLTPAVAAAGLRTVNATDDAAVPLGVVTETGPLLAPTGTSVAIWASLDDSTGATVPLNAALVTPLKPEPATFTAEHSAPLVGLSPVMTGSTVNAAVLVAVPPPVTMEMGPVVAPLGTVVVICVSLSTVKVVWSTPLNATAVAPVKYVPVITTVVPSMPPVGLKPPIRGGGGGDPILNVAISPVHDCEVLNRAAYDWAADAVSTL